MLIPKDPLGVRARARGSKESREGSGELLLKAGICEAYLVQLMLCVMNVNTGY